MKKILCIMGLGVLTSFISSISFAYEPLLGSDWAKKNPGFLPYDSCRMVITGYLKTNKPLDEDLFTDSLGFVVNGTLVNSNFLHCTSDEHKLEFMIPLRGQRPSGFGASLNFSTGTTWATVHSLHGKTVGELFNSKFAGPSIGLSVIAGGSFKSLMNASGIKLMFSSLRMGLEIDLSYVRMKLKSPIYLSQAWCEDPRVILKGTIDQRSEEDCETILGGRFKSTDADPHFYDDIKDLEFFETR